MSDPIENDLVREWLGAYLDGELNAERRAWVESHLAGCEGCRRELENLRSLSEWLHASPLPASERSAEAFLEQVLARLPEPERPWWQRGLRLGLAYAPMALFAAWAFFQAVSWVSTALLVALAMFPGLPFLPAVAAPGGPTGGWLAQNLAGLAPFGSLAELSGLTSLAPLGDLSWLPWFGPLAIFSLGITAVLAVLFLAWLAGLWSQRKQKMLNAESES